MSRILASTARCPYCSAKLPKAPTREHPCPSCKNVFYIQRGQDGILYAITESELELHQDVMPKGRQPRNEELIIPSFLEGGNKTKQKGISIAWTGVILGLIGQRLAPSLDILIIITVLALVVSIIGCYFWAKGKWWSGWFALWGALAPVGFLGVALLRDRKPGHKKRLDADSDPYTYGPTSGGGWDDPYDK